jgi:hypothetical protein
MLADIAEPRDAAVKRYARPPAGGEAAAGMLAHRRTAGVRYRRRAQDTS